MTKQDYKNPKQPQPISPEKHTDDLMIIWCDLVIDSFLDKWQRTKGSQARHTKEELKSTFRDSDSRLSKSERV